MRNKKRWRNLLFLLPSLAGAAVFYILPFWDVIKRSVMDDMGRYFTAGDNYRRIFMSRSFLTAGRNTLVFIIGSVPLLLVISLCIAVLLQQNEKGNRRLKIIYLLPMAIPVATLTGIWKIAFHEYGILNLIRNMFGMERVDWLNSRYAMTVVIVTYIWRNLGYTIILWLAGLIAVDHGLYEAAAMEGAGKGKQFFYITMPLLKPLSFTISVLAVLNTFKVFRDIYLISGDYPGRSIYMIQHLLNNWFTNMEFGRITAAAIIIVSITSCLVLILQLGFSWQKRGRMG